MSLLDRILLCYDRVCWFLRDLFTREPEHIGATEDTTWAHDFEAMPTLAEEVTIETFLLDPLGSWLLPPSAEHEATPSFDSVLSQFLDRTGMNIRVVDVEWQPWNMLEGATA